MKVKVANAGRFSYNGLVHEKGETLTVNGELKSVQTLIQMGDLVMCDPVEIVTKQTEADWKGMKKADLDKYAEERGCVLDGRKSLSKMREEFQTFLDKEKEVPEVIDSDDDETDVSDEDEDETVEDEEAEAEADAIFD